MHGNHRPDDAGLAAQPVDDFMAKKQVHTVATDCPAERPPGSLEGEARRSWHHDLDSVDEAHARANVGLLEDRPHAARVRRQGGLCQSRPDRSISKKKRLKAGDDRTTSSSRKSTAS